MELLHELEKNGVFSGKFNQIFCFKKNEPLISSKDFYK